MEETHGLAAKSKNGDCSRAEDRENAGHLGREGEKMLRLEGGKGVRSEVPINEAVPNFCFVLAETVLQLRRKRSNEQVGNIT